MAIYLFDTLPPPSIPLLPDNETYDISKYKNKPKLSPAEASQKCAAAIEKYDAEECKAHREEIDTLLVFAGLFSAVVTAFTIESYQWLQDDHNDAIVALLSRLADQPPLTTKGLSDAVSFRINAYWFLSLVLSLSSALVAIVCKQWVREFERHTGLSDATQFIGIRQMKLQGFEAWHVAGIVALIPLLLQTALGLFAVGVIELLWNLHRTVAIVALVPTLAALLFYAFTTLMPAVQAFASPFRIFRAVPQCPFKSPQALLTLRLLVLLLIILQRCSRVLRIVLHFLARNSSVLREFLCRKCFVFCRRVHASWNPESFPELWDTYEDVPHWSWRRIVVLWRRAERDLYVARRPISRRQRVPTSRQLDDDIQFPAFNHTKSWLQVDQVFTASRDHALTAYEYNEALRRGDTDTIPPQFYFSGLSWLRLHVHEVGMESWIRLSIWERINLFAHERHAQRIDELSHLLYGINAACPSAYLDLDDVGRDLPNLALRYARFMQMGGAFITELIIHTLDGITMTRGDAKILSIHLQADDESSHAFVHRILVLELSSGFIGRRDLSEFTKYMPYCSPRAVSYQAMACLVALQLRALLEPIRDLFRFGDLFAWNDLVFFDASGRARLASTCCAACRTLLLVTERLGRVPSDSRDPVPEREMSIFAALALAIDRCYEQWTLEGDSDDLFVNYTSKLAQPENQAVYLDLLSAALGSRILAADHIQRTILRTSSSHPGRSVTASPEPAQALGPRVSAHTALDLPDSSVHPDNGAPSLTPRDAELGAAVSADAESSQAKPTGGNPAAAPCDEEPGPTASPAPGSGATSAAALAGATTAAPGPGDFDAHGPPAGLGLAPPRAESSPVSATDGEEQTRSLDGGAAVEHDDAGGPATGGQACSDGELRPAASRAPAQSHDAMLPVALQDAQEPWETAAIDRPAM